MKNFSVVLSNLMVEESGQDLIEYALVAALVGLASVATLNTLTNVIKNAFNTIGNGLTNSL